QPRLINPSNDITGLGRDPCGISHRPKDLGTAVLYSSAWLSPSKGRLEPAPARGPLNARIPQDSDHQIREIYFPADVTTIKRFRRERRGEAFASRRRPTQRT